MLGKTEYYNTIKVGVLVPQSSIYPEAGVNFVNGIKLYFTLFDNKFFRGKVDLKVLDIRQGTTSTTKEKAHELLMGVKPDCIIAYVNSSVGLELAETLSPFNIPLLISNLGETAVDPSLIQGNLYFNTFQFWQSYFHLGQYLGTKKEQDWVLVSALHDTGYDPLRAFRAGLQSNGAHIAQEIYLNASDSKEVIQDFYDQIQMADNLTPALFFPPHLLDPLIEELGKNFDEMVTTPLFSKYNKTVKYWAFPEGILHTSDPYIVKGTKEYLQTLPDLFHVLGYRAGAMLYQASKSLDQPSDDQMNIINTWGKYQMELGPAKFSVDVKTHDLSGKTNIFKGTSHENSNEIIHTVSANNIDDIFCTEMTQQRSAFSNPYMFY